MNIRQPIEDLDPGELRTYVAELMAFPDVDRPDWEPRDVGDGIARLAAVTGNLPMVLRDLAADVEAIA